MTESGRRPAVAALASLAAAGSLLLAGCATAPAGATYANPLLDRDFPDPAVLRAPDGRFYAYATQSSLGHAMLNIQVARSSSLVDWELLGDALPRKPQWASGTQMFWAPHVIYDGQAQLYFMYYSAQPDGGKGKCLAVATSRAPAGPFTDSGAPMLCGQSFEHIDPMAFDDPQSGKRLLYWGSASMPIKVQELAVDRLRFLPGSAPLDVVHADAEKPYRALVEGAWVVFRHGLYYLFYSGDRCCGPQPRYAIMVARSASPYGPFEHLDKPGAPGNSAIVERSGFWTAPGHCSVVADDAGADWILYHAMDPARMHFEDRRRSRPTPRMLLADPLVYQDGWPRVAGGQPSVGTRPAPAVRSEGSL